MLKKKIIKKNISTDGGHFGPPMGKNVLKSSPLKPVIQDSKHVIDGP
jgi:hypothetical protein